MTQPRRDGGQTGQCRAAEYNTLAAKHRIFPFKFKRVPKPAARIKNTPTRLANRGLAFWKAHGKLKLQPLARAGAPISRRAFRADRRYKLDFAVRLGG